MNPDSYKCPVCGKWVKSGEEHSDCIPRVPTTEPVLPEDVEEDEQR